MAIPAVATAQVSTTTSATFSGAESEPDGSAEAYCGGAGQDACTSGDPVQVSWGIGGSGQRSSLSFEPANAAGVGEFSLGTLTHNNTVVGPFNGITAVDFRVDTTVRDGDRSVEFSASHPMELGVHEVIDSVRPCPYGGDSAGRCADAVSLPQPNASFPYVDGNVSYLLQIVGFRGPDGQTAQHTISPEGTPTEVQLMARLTKTPRLAADAVPTRPSMRVTRSPSMALPAGTAISPMRGGRCPGRR